MKRTGQGCVAGVLLVGVLFMSACGGDDDGCVLTAAWDEVATAPAGAPLAIAVACVDTEGTPVPNEALVAQVTLGGGGLETGSATAGLDGRATFLWTLGVVPVDQRIVVRRAVAAAQPGPVDEIAFVVRATLDVPSAPTPFGDVEAALAGAGIDGSTEDLAFAGDALMLAVPGHLVAVDTTGKATLVSLSGDGLDGPLGIVFDADGLLWVADAAGHALKTVDTNGVVATALSTDGVQPLGQPNFVAIGPDGAVWLSDPCIGEVLRYDPATTSVAVVASFDLGLQGGPNGLAFDAAGALWVTTENVGLLCMDGSVDPLAAVAGLYRIDPTWAQQLDPAQRARTVLAGFAHFGDGLAFDAEGNLYALFDFIEGLALASSELHVIAASDLAAFVAQDSGAAEAPTTAVVLATTDVVMANLEWGQGAFEPNRIHLSLLAIPAFGLQTRGLVTFDAGIPGATW